MCSYVQVMIEGKVPAEGGLGRRMGWPNFLLAGRMPVEPGMTGMDNGWETGVLSLPRNPGSIFDVAPLSSLSRRESPTTASQSRVRATDRYEECRWYPETETGGRTSVLPRTSLGFPDI